MADFQSFNYSFPHRAASCFEVGRLQTINRLPVLPNDSISISAEAVLRQSPLRRQVSFDAKVDVFGFFVPHRHVYRDKPSAGQNVWLDFLKEGVDETSNLPTVSQSRSPLIELVASEGTLKYLFQI